MKKQSKLASFQLTFFIIQTQIGVGVLGLPFNVFSVSKGDAWISVLTAGGIIQVIVILMWLLGRRFPSSSILEYSKLLVGKFTGTLITIGFLIYGILVTSLILVSAAEIIKSWSLTLTPKWVIMVLLILPAIYIGKETVMEISNVYVVVSGLIMFLLIVSVIVLFIYPVDWRYLFPIGAAGGLTILRGAKEAYFSMFGFELLLFLYPHFKHNGSRSILKSVTTANVIVTLAYTFFTLVSLVTFSPEELKIVPQPVLYYVKSLYFQVLERIDLLFVSLWVVNVITSLTGYLFLSTESSTQILKRFKKLKRGYSTMFLGFFPLLLALMPGNEQEIEWLNQWVVSFSFIFVIVIPILLLCISLIFKKKESESA